MLLCLACVINSGSKGNAVAHETGATHYHAQLDLPDKGCEIKGLVACRMLLNLISLGVSNIAYNYEWMIL